MFGLTEQEMDLYRDLSQDFAVRELTPRIVGNSKFITPLIQQDGEIVPNRQYINQLVTDIETLITFVTSHMAYEYAHLQDDSEITEQEIIKHLHSKYEDYLITQFIKYSIAFTTDIASEIVGGIILELPYLYAEVIQDANFDEDEFLEEKLQAYNDYLNENFTDSKNYEKTEEEGEE